MPRLRNMAIRWYRKAFGAPAGSDIRDEGFDTVLDGNSAVALSEAAVSNHAVLGNSSLSADAESVWLGESRNVFGETLSAQAAEGPRGVIAAATGSALSGRRSTAFISGPDITTAQDLLVSAAGKHAPLVLHLTTRAATAHGAAIGSGHDCINACADSGAFVLVAANVQQAVDFTYIARCVAEQSLVPGIVVMDGEQTALASQNVRLLSPSQVAALLGPADERIDTPNEAQKLLFGEERRRIPAWHDLDEPVLTGALFDRDSYALGALARGPYFDDFVSEALADCSMQFAEKTGRRYEPLSTYRVDGAKTVLLALGSAIETACAAADVLRREHKRRVGVIGLQTLRPFPDVDIARILNGVEQVLVLERLDTPMSAEPPLVREIRACLNRCEVANSPQCHSAVYGVGGLPLSIADLVQLCTTDAPRSRAYLGVAFDNPSDDQPKRAVLLDALRRAYPDVAGLGIRASPETTAPPPKNSLTIAFENGGNEIAGQAGALLHRIAGGHIRSRPATGWATGTGIAWIMHGDDNLHDPGDEPRPQVVVDVQARSIRICDSAAGFSAPDGDDPDDILLGSLFGALLSASLFDAGPRRIVSVREQLLEGLDQAERERRVEAFRSGLENLAALKDTATRAADRWHGEAPTSVQHLGRADDRYASLPRFWDQVGVLYRDGFSDQLTAGPYLATGVVPPLSATFNDLSRSRSALPTFDPAACTGCSRCWTSCPDSAIAVVAASPTALIESGIQRTGADAVRQVTSKLASRIASQARTAEPATSFGPMLRDAFSWLEDKLPEERRGQVRDGVDRIVDELGSLPVAVTEPFFQNPEARDRGSGELLSIVVNPDACKDCGLCVANCEPGALLEHDQTSEALETAQERWTSWMRTPDTTSATIDRTADDPDFGELAALLLSRYCQFAVAGGDSAEPGSGEKLALRLLLSACEYHQQPIVQRFAKSLADSEEAVATRIRETLAETLAVDDLDAITEQLRQTTSPTIDVKTLADGDRSVDTEDLLRLADLVSRISAARRRLVAGEHGLGRARYGLAIAGGSVASWAGAFPDNPFQAPTLIDMSGDAAQLAAGLVEGQLQETAELARLLRLARLEVEQPDGVEWQRESLGRLRWQDLTEDELALCPPLVLAGSDEMLGGRGLGQLVGLINSGLPVKILVLQSLDFGLERLSFDKATLGHIALSQRKAYVAQSSIATPRHLGNSFLRALAFEGPALLQVYAPSPNRHGFASSQSIEMAELAVTSRTLPLFRYDPGADGAFGSRISLEENPVPHEALVDHEEARLTPADWAIRQDRFAACFAALDESAPTPTPLHDWLELDGRGRARKTPFICRDGERYSMTPAMLDVVSQCVGSWRTLQELAGIVTPFTSDVEQRVRAELAAGHQSEIDAMKQSFDDRIHAIHAETEAEIAGKIRSRLLQLVSRKRG